MSKVVLLSGGLDSALCLQLAINKGDEVIALGFDYGQPHSIELDYASRFCQKRGVPFKVLALPVLPKPDGLVFSGRNLLLAAQAAVEALAERADTVVMGANLSDSKDFPDCRAGFFEALEKCLSAYGLKMEAPLLGLSKAEIVTLAASVGLDRKETWTCYSPVNEEPCGVCYSCRGLEEAVKSATRN